MYSPENQTERIILTAADLKTITVSDNGSLMVDLKPLLPQVVVLYEKKDMEPYTGSQILVREALVSMIAEAYALLQIVMPGCTFRIQYGYRHPDIQSEYFARRHAFFLDNNPQLSSEELIELTHTQVAYPMVAGHPTGGAIDLTILNADGIKIDMGTDIADYSIPNKCFTYSTSITETQATHRKVLHDLMLQVGFAPFYGEWWHFSYGDREWAKFYGFAASLFDQIDVMTK